MANAPYIRKEAKTRDRVQREPLVDPWSLIGSRFTHTCGTRTWNRKKRAVLVTPVGGLPRQVINAQGCSRGMTRPEVFKNSQVGSSRVKWLSNLAGRVTSFLYVGSGVLQLLQVGSDQEVIQVSRVGSGHNPRTTSHSRVEPA